MLQNRSLNSLWLVIDGNVYDITSYLHKHPAGVNVITRSLKEKKNLNEFVIIFINNNSNHRKFPLLLKKTFFKKAFDSTESFHGVLGRFRGHSEEALKELEMYKIGKLKHHD